MDPLLFINIFQSNIFHLIESIINQEDIYLVGTCKCQPCDVYYDFYCFLVIIKVEISSFLKQPEHLFLL